MDIHDEMIRLQYTESTKLIGIFVEADFPVVREGLHGGTHGTEIPYSDHRVGGNIVRYSGFGWSGQRPSLEVVA